MEKPYWMIENSDRLLIAILNKLSINSLIPQDKILFLQSFLPIIHSTISLIAF